MVGKFFKELIIVLLLCLAIILLLGILLYEYVPISKTVPTPVSYSTAEDVKEELQEDESVNEEQIIMTYKVDSNDLNNYKRTQNYKPGKANPFSTYEISGPDVNSANSSTGGQSENVNGSTGTTSTNENNANSTTGGTFFQKKGTK